MKLPLRLLAAPLLASVFLPSLPAQTDAPPVKLAPVVVEATKPRPGAETPLATFIFVQIKNFQDEDLGRIQELAVDLVNGRIVEVLVVSDASLDVGGKVVAVPPLALVPDVLGEVYRLDISAEKFKTAPAIDVARWVDSGHSDRVAASYRLFNQEPYFLEEGATASPTAKRPKVALGYVERANKLLDLPVKNLQNETLGKIWNLSFDIAKGRILSVMIVAPNNSKIRSIVPAMALNFNPARDGLLLDDSREDFADEPRYIFTAAAYGQEAYSTEEPYRGPRTSVPLVQGRSYRDIDQTVHINKSIRAAKIDCRHVEVGTLHDRVTLRGSVKTAADKAAINAIAIAAARVELVDNQIVVAAAE